MESQIFEAFRQLILKESGINLSNEKKQLLSNRIQKRLRILGLQSPSEYLRIIELDVSGEELVKLIDAISTNVTFFWREPEHFSVFTTLMDEYAARGRSELKVWCAASSSGEEPYTLSMMVEEHRVMSRGGTRILATDICTRVLNHALVGEYEERQLEKLPAVLRDRYFAKIDPDGEAKCSIVPSVRQRLLFKKLNLAKFPYPLAGKLDVIFCRNVMIYFDRELRQKIVNEFSRLLAPGGTLFLSHSENLLGIKHELQPYAVATYRKEGV